MDYFSWLAQEQELTNAALTVRAQALPPLDRDRLVHDLFFPRTNAESLKIRTITDVDFRPVADRREWNVRGRLIPIQTPTQAELEGLPIESFFAIEEKEINDLVLSTFGNQELFRSIVGSRLPARVDGLVNANRRRMEKDALKAWHSGTITVMNPQTGGSYTVSFGFAAGRYQTAATAWDDGAVNAYDEFLAWVRDGEDEFGASSPGAVLHRSIYTAIQADAPKGLLDPNRMLTREEFQSRVQADLGHDFTFYILEHRSDLFVDAGLTTTRDYYWAEGKLALLPPGIAIGNMAYAPVVRAMEIARVEADAEIDVRGMAVFREVENGGRKLTVECQVNSFPIPNEQNIWVIDTGISR